MATPHVSGAAALIWSRGDVTSNAQVVNILLNSADRQGVDPVRLDSWTIHGGLNLHDALSFGATNLPPVANAGSDQTIIDSDGDNVELVSLDASGSSDADGSVVAYEWREGSTVLTVIAAPQIWLPVGTHTLTLQVTDDHGATGTDDVIVTIIAAANAAPVANAGLDLAVTDTNNDGAESVMLDATASSDADGAIVSYEWREGSAVIGTGATPTISLSVGTHTLMLRVTDDEGATATDTVVVTVNASVPTSAHIGDLDAFSTANKNVWTAHVTIGVHDTNHRAVAGAVVTGSWGDGASGGATCTTGTSGTCVVVSDPVRKREGNVTFTIDSIAASGLSYAAGQNHNPDGDSNGTMIVVGKP
jgi:hypothetical protein